MLPILVPRPPTPGGSECSQLTSETAEWCGAAFLYRCGLKPRALGRMRDDMKQGLKPRALGRMRDDMKQGLKPRALGRMRDDMKQGVVVRSAPRM